MSAETEVGGRLDGDDARELLDRQTEVLELIARAAPLPDVLTEILTSLERLMPGARCSVLLLDRDRGTLHHGAAPQLPQQYVAAIDGLEVRDGAGSCGTAAALNAPVVAVDVETDPRWVDFREAARSAGLRSCWSTPIDGRDGRPVGTFAVYHEGTHEPTARERLLVDRCTHLASVAIDHAALLAELVESEERLRRSFDDNALGMAIVDRDRVVVTSNRALATLVAARSDLVGRTLAELVTPRAQALRTVLDDLDRSVGGPTTFEATLHRDDRHDVEVEVTVSVLRRSVGSAGQYVVNVLDLTERRAAERDRRARLEAETARRTAEQHSHAKSELLAAVGHEARTPIQAIVGFAELLGTMDLDEERRREALGYIDAAAGHVMELLADVLDLSRVEAGALPLDLEPVQVRDVAVEVLALLSARAEPRQIELAHELGDDVVLADRRRLRQVLLNLVGNAIRYGHDGGHVVVRLHRAPDPRTVALTVDDDGPGIPPDLVPRLFTAFNRAHAGGAAVRGGGPGDLTDESVGLGLGLAYGLVRAMGGDLRVAITGPAGTSILLTLRRAEASR